MVCSLIGHRVVSDNLRPKLRAALLEMIEKNHVDRFYVGDKGAFDILAYKELMDVQKEHPDIEFYVVLSYYPSVPKQAYFDFGKAIYPCGIEKVPYRYAMLWRNRWLIDQADFLIAYVTSEIGNSARIMALAKRRGVTVLNLAER